MKKCKYCQDLDEMCWECPDEPHHGEVAYCDECDAEYFRMYEMEIQTCNEQAHINHPELKKL
jgi:hypothetical protein